MADQEAMRRSLSALHNEVRTARSEIPKLPAIVAEIHTETSAARSNADRRIATLERELKLAKDKISNLRVEQSQTDYGLKQLEDAKPGVELKFQTSETSFVMRDVHPDARAAWKRFVEGILPQNEAATGLLIDPPSGSA